MFKERISLPRCEYGVYDQCSEEGESSCGEPAIAQWQWNIHEKPLFVCEEHDEKICSDMEMEDS